MRILVTGTAGFIGSHFTALALEHGHQLHGLDALTYSGRAENLIGQKFDTTIGDICNAPLVRKILHEFQPDALVNFAAESHVCRSIESREEFLRTNITGVNTLLEESLRYWRGGGEMSSSTAGHPKRDFRVLQVSTDEVYGSLGAFERPWVERSPYAPNNPYAASKASGDYLARAYWKTYGLPVLITHSANNYGPRQHPEKMIPTFIRQIANDEPVTLHGDGLHVRDWLWVEDHCVGIMRALQKGAIGETYNFGGRCERANRDVAAAIAEAMGCRLRFKFVQNRPGNDRRYSTDITKAFEQLGWQPLASSIEPLLPSVIRWYLDNPNYGEQYGR